MRRAAPMLKHLPGKLRKAWRIARRPRFAKAALKLRVMAAVEHLEAIRRTAAGTLVDVGANKGQFSLAFRAVRPEAQIVAFEPLAEEADLYARLFQGDSRVALHRTALGDAAGVATFHVTDRRDSSSLLKPSNGQNRAFGVFEEKVIEVALSRLDGCVAFDRLPRPILLKIDVQGAELQVLAGCDDLAVDYVYVELSYVELYERQPLHDEVAAFLGARGFRLAGVYNPQETAAFGPTQADFLFERVQ